MYILLCEFHLNVLHRHDPSLNQIMIILKVWREKKNLPCRSLFILLTYTSPKAHMEAALLYKGKSGCYSWIGAAAVE